MLVDTMILGMKFIFQRMWGVGKEQKTMYFSIRSFVRSFVCVHIYLIMDNRMYFNYFFKILKLTIT